MEWLDTLVLGILYFVTPLLFEQIIIIINVLILDTGKTDCALSKEIRASEELSSHSSAGYQISWKAYSGDAKMPS